MVSVVIINHNTKKITEECIKSVYENTNRPFELIIVDNSSENAQKIHPHKSNMKVLHCANRGFGHACNLGMHKSSGDYILLLNSDTIVHKNAIDVLSDYLDTHSDAGAVGGKTLLSDGTLDHSCKRGLPTPSACFFYMTGLAKLFPKNPVFARYHMTFLDENSENYVEVLSGAFMMVRKSVMDKIGGFDERFFMYGEDIDLCCSIANEGYRLVYLPEAVITHLRGQSGLSTKNPKVLYHFYKSMDLFYKKNMNQEHSLPINILVSSAIWGKFIVSYLMSLWRK